MLSIYFICHYKYARKPCMTGNSQIQYPILIEPGWTRRTVIRSDFTCC